MVIGNFVLYFTLLMLFFLIKQHIMKWFTSLRKDIANARIKNS